MPEQVFGIQEVLAALGGWSDAAKAAIEQAFKDGVDQGVQVATDLSPVRTGYLKSRNARQDVGWSGNTFEVDMVNDAPYAIYQDQGTRFVPAHPFFTAGTEAAGQAITNNLNALK